MGYLRKTLERRTFSQDRYYILIKRQKSGKATFNELTELDEIVNRVPDIREKVIIENFFSKDDANGSPNNQQDQNPLQFRHERSTKGWEKLKSFFSRLFALQIHIKVQEFNLLC